MTDRTVPDRTERCSVQGQRRCFCARQAYSSATPSCAIRTHADRLAVSLVWRQQCRARIRDKNTQGARAYARRPCSQQHARMAARSMRVFRKASINTTRGGRWYGSIGSIGHQHLEGKHAKCIQRRGGAVAHLHEAANTEQPQAKLLIIRQYVIRSDMVQRHASRMRVHPADDPCVRKN